MSKKQARRYRNTLAVVRSGFDACLQNADDLVDAAAALEERKLYSLSLSLSVLALEELAKLCVVDGLLFARPDDHKADRFAKSVRSHAAKLGQLGMLQFLVQNLASANSQSSTDQRFRQAVAIAYQDMLERGDQVLELLHGNDFTSLDVWKQKGFYVSVNQRGFEPPRDMVSQELAVSVRSFAWRANDAVKFAIRQGGLDQYFDNAQATRAALAEDDHLFFELLGEIAADRMHEE